MNNSTNLAIERRKKELSCIFSFVQVIYARADFEIERKWKITLIIICSSFEFLGYSSKQTRTQFARQKIKIQRERYQRLSLIFRFFRCKRSQLRISVPGSLRIARVLTGC